MPTRDELKRAIKNAIIVVGRESSETRATSIEEIKNAYNETFAEQLTVALYNFIEQKAAEIANQRIDQRLNSTINSRITQLEARIADLEAE